ncbi:glutamate 5-kinase [Tsuneonella sp. YG55]|uniref:Glutamate 5-kinase n=1 Tax=Tsuneonella litorea TaxID=2976475 RepID=A0A9X2W1I5_9SPHN|nr:glutamate 5-kinase [Tsuneonella litorea]MCT2559295.1 glutamate 5-kinase [Tsuneonella litorea]
MISDKRVVIKLGSSLLTDEKRLMVRWAFMQRVVEDIALLRDEGYEVIVCSSGAVALGMRMIGVTPATAGLRDKQAAAACGMPLLLNAYKQVGHEHGLDIAQVLVTLGDFEDHARFLNTKNTLHRLLAAGIVPIINENDTITTEEIRVGDNDRLAAKVAQMVEARHLVILTGVDGLYDRNPDEPGAKFVEVVDDASEYIEATAGISTLGSGGMLTKIQAANMAQNAGCTTLIANGEAEDPISSVLKGKRRCTTFIAHSEPTDSWAAWLTNRLQMAGSIVVTDSGAEAIATGTRPIDRGDVVEVRGKFVKGDVVHIYDQQGVERARGMTDFSSDETEILVRNLEIPVEQLLGYQSRAVLVESNNMVRIDDRHLPWDDHENKPTGAIAAE